MTIYTHDEWTVAVSVTRGDGFLAERNVAFQGENAAEAIGFGRELAAKAADMGVNGDCLAALEASPR